MRLLIFYAALLLSLKTVAQYQPENIAMVGGQKSGHIVLGLFRAQQGVSAAHYINNNHWEQSRIDSFTVAIFRDSLLVFFHRNKGNIWGPELVSEMKNMKIKDRVIIFDIWATWPGLPQSLLQPLEYIMQ